MQGEILLTRGISPKYVKSFQKLIFPLLNEFAFINPHLDRIGSIGSSDKRKTLKIVIQWGEATKQSQL
jgi:hypothetical protein